MRKVFMQWGLGFAVISSIAMAGSISGCSGDDDDDAGGPIDGSWEVTTLLCDTASQPIPGIFVDIDDDEGEFVLVLPGTAGTVCTSTITEEYAYPTSTTIEITPTANSCNPSGAACAPLFGGSDACPVPPPVTFTHDLTGTTLTFTKTSVGPPLDGCPAGQTVTYIMAPSN